jgi:hypothetical protein
MISEETWHELMDLQTDLLLHTTGYEGSLTHRLHRVRLIWASPVDPGSASFMHAPGLIAFEEFDAAVFNAIHGYYRQAFNCMRNALETLAIAAGLDVTKTPLNSRNGATGKKPSSAKPGDFSRTARMGRRAVSSRRWAQKS